MVLIPIGTILKLNNNKYTTNFNNNDIFLATKQAMAFRSQNMVNSNQVVQKEFNQFMDHTAIQEKMENLSQ